MEGQLLLNLYINTKDTADIKNIVTLKARYIYDSHDKYINDLRLEDVEKLFNEIEMPLVKVLAKMATKYAIITEKS